MIRYFYLLFSSLLLITFLSCNNQKVEEAALECEIVSPISGQIYPPTDPLFLIAKYDRFKFNAPHWQFSMDNGKTWIDIKIFEGDNEKQVTGRDIIYDIDVKQWVPDSNNIQDTVVSIKASAYAGSKFVTINNVKIKIIKNIK